MRLRHVLPLLLAAVLPLGAEDVFSPTPAVPAAGAPTVVAEDGNDAVLRISDAPWLDRELIRFAAALGRDPKPLRRWMAETFYHTRSLDAIDTARPALFIWRKGDAPLQAIIPIRAAARRQFVDEFGVMGVGEPPLVRVGDRDGTVVFTQNHPSGLREYRLLVMDSVAFLAHNADECRKLAARAPGLLPTLAADAAPLSLTCSGDWLRASGMLDWAWSPRLAVPQWLPGAQLLDLAQQAVVAQTDGMTFELRGGEGRARLAVRLIAHPDSSLAAWIASQQNQANRLQVQLTAPTTAIRVSAHIAWQDKLEVLGRALVPALAAARGAAWTPAVEESWIQAFTVAERSTDAAWKLDVPRPGGQVQTLVLEQPRAEEQFQHLDHVAEALLAAGPGVGTVNGYPAAVRELKPDAAQPGLQQVLCATTRHVLLADGWNLPVAEVLASAEDTAKRLQQVSGTAGEQAVATVWCNVGRLVQLAPGIDTEVSIPDAVVQGTLRAAGVNVLQFDLAAPLDAVAQALGHLPDEHAKDKDKGKAKAKP